ncbi:MAG TPA: response regulator [Flavisolibacter sp.]|jgi:CheY-like chemotaxis protein|nr:response regulator [Flavisolibacter sp.]
MITSKPLDTKVITNIILAEDDIDDQNIFQIALQEIDSRIQTQFVSNGKELLNLLQFNKPDILFLDLDMPYKNGLQCLIEMQTDPELEKVPVIVFSSTTKPSNIQTAYEMGAHLFFIKPPIYSDYLSSIKAIFKLNWGDPQAVKEQYCVNGRYTAFS